MCPACRAGWLASNRTDSLALFTMLSPIGTALALSAACIPLAMPIDAMSAVHDRMRPCIVMCAGH